MAWPESSLEEEQVRLLVVGADSKRWENERKCRMVRMCIDT